MALREVVMGRKNYWSPYLAGVGLGLTLLATFYIAGWGLGASSAFSLLTGVGVEKISPEFLQHLKYFSDLDVKSPLLNWVVFEVGGLFLGALAGATLSRNFKLQLDKAPGMGGKARALTAFSGGILIGFASRLARGCTSGVALSGGAELAVAGWVFVIAMFVSGFIGAAFLRRLWS
jgi:uncharacterized membrane protein YedE/YeeE